MSDEEPVTTVVKDALTEARQLIRLEVEAAKAEAREDLARIKTSAIALGVSYMSATVGIALLIFALLLAVAPRPLTIALVGAAMLVVAASLVFFVGIPRIPKKPLEKTMTRLKTDAHILKEHTA